MPKEEPARLVSDKDKKATEKGVLYVGIDLGTSRTSVSASNGVRETVYSFVGYPKDALSIVKQRKDERIYGGIGPPARASIKNKEQTLEATRGILDAAMICSEPFAVAYGLELLEDTLVIDIGAGTVDLCRMHGTMPEE